MESGWSTTDSDCGAATETAAEKYLRNERVGSSVAGEVSATASDASHHLAVAAQRDSELAVEKLRTPCRKVLERLTEHWDGGTAPADVAKFLPWNFSTDRVSELQISTAGNSNPNTS